MDRSGDEVVGETEPAHSPEHHWPRSRHCFLALHGPFTAHVTGNSSPPPLRWCWEPSSAVAKLLALPVSCTVVILARLRAVSAQFADTANDPDAEFPAIGVCRRLCLGFGTFVSGGGSQAILTGMTLVSAMAVQNALHRVHLGTAPPTTIMTGTTQIMIDIADLPRGVEPEAKAAAKARHGGDAWWFCLRLGSIVISPSC